MATKPPPLPPDARRPMGSHAPTGDEEPDTDPDNPAPALPAPPAFRTPPAPPAPPRLPPTPAGPDAAEFAPPPELIAPWREPPRDTEARIEITNRSDGGFFYWLLRFYTFGVLCALGLLMMAGFGTYIYFAATLP